MSAALRQARKEIDDFEKKVGLIAPSSAKAGLALSNLGRVASDAPFGFIAIQNNIEPLLQSFQSLSRESGGVGGALKALGTSLIGPTGLLLGFSLVSSAVTVAIQKYGSLGGALDALFGKQDALNGEIRSAAESYAKYNEQLKSSVSIQSNAAGSTQGEISRVQALAGIVSDTTATYLQRNNALQELAKINKTYFGNLDIESVKLGTLTKAVDAYTKATIQSAVTKGFETEIGTANVELNKQENILKKLQDRRRTLQAAPQRIVGAAATVDTRDLIAATQAELDQARVVTELRARIRELNTAIGESIRQFNAITAPINAANTATQNNTSVTNTNTSAINKRTAALQQAEEKQKSLAKILAEAGQVQTLDFTSLFDVDQAEAKSRLERLGIVTAYRDAFEEALAPSQGRLGRDFTIIPPAAIQAAIDNVNRLRDAGIQAGAAFSSVISPAIDGVFSAIENGQSVIKSLGDSFKKLVIDLIKATIKAAAFALVISAASGGTINFGTAFRGALQLGGTGGGFGGLRQAAAPTFGGVGGFGGGLQLAGQVVFTQRGTDLVGVLNSSNARINRVG